MVKCVDCNGVGLVSTGADKLNLNHGAMIVCKVCTGTGKVIVCKVCTGTGKVPETANQSSAGPVDSTAPNAEGSPEEATGESSGLPSPVVPKIGDPCEMQDGSAGVLGKTDIGNWVCVPKPPAG